MLAVGWFFLCQYFRKKTNGSGFLFCSRGCRKSFSMAPSIPLPLVLVYSIYLFFFPSQQCPSCRLGPKLHWHTQGAREISPCMQLIELVQGPSRELCWPYPTVLWHLAVYLKICLLNLVSDCSVTSRYFVESTWSSTDVLIHSTCTQEYHLQSWNWLFCSWICWMACSTYSTEFKFCWNLLHPFNESISW